MNKLLKQTGLLIGIIILLPAIFITLIEINSLNENEKTIERVFTKQIESVLYTINQYAQSVTEDWKNRLDFLLSRSRGGKEEILADMKKLFSDVNWVESVFIVRENKPQFFNINPSYIPEGDSIKILLEKNRTEIERLSIYRKQGYSKVQPLKNDLIRNEAIIIFLFDTPDGKEELCGMIINPENFINRVMAPKIQEVSMEEYSVVIFSEEVNEVVFREGKANLLDLDDRKQFWIFPEYSLGISLKSATISDLVRARSWLSMILIMAMNLVIVLAGFILYRNIRKQIEFTQIKSDFVSNVSHELRTPLALISMFAETLEMGRVRTEEKKQEYYNIIHRETHRLSNIVNKILSFSKMEAGKRSFSFSPTDLNSLVDEALDTYSFHLSNNGFKYEVSTGESLPAINADSEAITEAVVNLIDNAMKYSEEKKEIKISTGRMDDYIFLAVKDSGMGISKEDQEKIFEKFFRVSSGLVHNTKGTGLGLSLVKQIIDAHKGEIKLESKPGEGSTFTLLFPVNSDSGS